MLTQDLIAKFEELTEESQVMTYTYRNDLPEYHELQKQINQTVDEAEAQGISIHDLFSAQERAALRAYQRTH